MASRVLVKYNPKVVAITESNSHKQQPPNASQIYTQKNKALPGSRVFGLSINPFCLRGSGFSDLTLVLENRIKISEEKGDSKWW